MKCVVCGATALFRVKKKGFCADHHQAAEQERIAQHGPARSPKAPTVERKDNGLGAPAAGR
jgi:hypothetical protein